MSGENVVKPSGELKGSKDSRGGAALYPSAIIGIVKNNIDPARSGRIQVYLKRVNSPEQENPNNWTTVSYMSPFFGTTQNASSSDGYGDYVGNPVSYGFWATPPDIGTEVICVFLNGDPNMGYYIGCVPTPGLNHMVPAIGASDSIIANSGEAQSYGGAKKLPVTEINNANPKQKDNPVLTYQPRPVHSYQAAIMFKQGILRDTDRGPIGSSSMRESPSRVFGMSTPGRPIYQGGYTNQTIGDAIKNDKTPPQNFKVIGRTGGHSFVMDDGDVVGKDQLVRLRTGAGHTILMNDAAQTLFILHANGQSYIELGKEGTIDMYSTNSVNIRTQGDLNLHADNNVNINAGKNVNISGKNLATESIESTTHFTGTTYKQYTKGNHTTKVDGQMSLDSKGDASLSSPGMTYINGKNVNLNTGTASLKPEAVKQLPVIAHTDTLGDATKGFAPAPGKLASIVSRAPAHAPWANANQGVDVKVNLAADANMPAAPAKETQTVNNAAPDAPANPTTPAVAATVPSVPAVSAQMDKATTSAAVSQMAVNTATGPVKDVVEKGAVVVQDAAGNKTAVVGALAVTPSQLVESGHIKPGADVAINTALQRGATVDLAMPKNVFTGKDGITSVSSFLSSTGTQVAPAIDLMKKGEKQLKSVGLIKGNESPIATAGMVMSTAAAGIDATVAFAQKAGGAANDFINQAVTLTGKATTSVSDLIAGGKHAAGMAENSNSALSGIDVGDKLKGLASGMFSKVTESFKSFEAGKPQNLTQLAEKAASSASSAASSAYDSAKNALSGATSGGSDFSVKGALDSAAKLGGDAQGMLAKASSMGSKVGLKMPPGIPAVVGGVTNTIKAGSSLLDKVPGTDKISKEIADIKGSITSGYDKLAGSVTNAKDSLSKAAGSVSALASTGLSKDDAAKLSSSVNSMGGGGAVDVKLPVVATETTSSPVNTASLVGNSKVPPVDEPTAADALVAADAEAAYQAKGEDIASKRQAWRDAKDKYGPESQQALAAYTAYKQATQTS